MSLEDRVALITGAGRGIGRAIALHLAKEGAIVAVNALRSESAIRTAEEVTGAGGSALAVSGDVSSQEDVAAMIDKIVTDYGRLDILVNNAGIIQDQIMASMSEEQWERVIAVNLRSVFLCSRASVRYMLRGRWGRIINLSSVARLIGNTGQANYAAAKAGIVGFTRVFAREVGGHGITVNALAPGFIETDMTAGLSDKRRREALSRIPLGCLGTADDVAAACVFLASEAARYITGQVLTVDGGMTCT
ncbi:MAG: 3-oxoacyl-[acyl-carrier-protein] reductase [Dehalococcoidia bacterium]|nr:3-oxoacyl-[acyl-carrier-protein] reductase [Dehalococcoidia bacterium]